MFKLEPCLRQSQDVEIIVRDERDNIVPFVASRTGVEKAEVNGIYIVKKARRTSCFSLGLGLAVSIFQFWIVYHTVAQEKFVALVVVMVSSGYFPVFECIS